MKKLKILCVCSSNLCESRMAEKFLNVYLKKKGIRYQVESAGLHQTDTRSPSTEALLAMEDLGFSMQITAPKLLTAFDLSLFDTILVFNDKARGYIIRDFEKLEIEKIVVLNGHNGGIANPYRGKPADYRTCASSIKEAVRNFVEKIENGA